MFPLMTRGISPRTVAPIRSFNSVTRLKRRRTPAEARPANTAAMMPKPTAAKRRGLVGLAGVVGGVAGRICLVVYRTALFPCRVMTWVATALAKAAATRGWRPSR